MNRTHYMYLSDISPELFEQWLMDFAWEGINSEYVYSNFAAYFYEEKEEHCD